jgi:dihydroorotate dehydrogenase electron transfer subunit
MTTRQVQANVLFQEAVGADHHRVLLEAGPDFTVPLPGQYLQCQLGTGESPFLLRPFSLAEARRTGTGVQMEILYGVVGAGTDWLSRRKTGDSVPIIGPLGRPFEIQDGLRPVLVAGGRGVAPLLFLHRILTERGEEPLLVLGARREELLFGREAVRPSSLRVSTDDGSAGTRGTVLDSLTTLDPNWLSASILYACGPGAMLAAVARFALEREIACQLSIETLFACGFGVCRGCAVPRADGKGYAMACTDGPVFDVRSLDWSESEAFVH